MTRIVRRSIRGTTTPAFAERAVQSAAKAIVIALSPDEDLSGAACTRPGVNPDWFFPADEDELGEHRAKRICANCPVREMCLALALRRREPSGIFGGLDVTERKELIQSRRGAAAGWDGRVA
ncbi:WhiB family transcriptional regulator [Kitasatospora sp. NPDC048722]|uniref:WhiB family transcriptional regulator n=1 Tax=Kitasatospora sp. NPDC048722 TaxID=3155639 RepID=UPI0033FD42B5